MSLNWNIQDFDEDHEIMQEDEWERTKSIIFLTMTMGINHITEKNYVEFFTRVSFYEHVNGSFFWKNNDGVREDIYFTLEDVKKRIGIWTNASTITKAKFRNSVYDSFSKDILWEIRQQKQKTVE